MSDSQPASADRAVFLSYASQDAEAARRICDSLRSGGVEVWFDAAGGLEHGDEWDAKIRRQIKECVLFIPVISASTQARHEGYFRLEWELAAQRAMSIASGVPFVLPVLIDDTREPDAIVPDRFRMVQWTKLRSGEVPPEVQQRFLKLWSHRTGVLKHETAGASVNTTSLPAVPSATETIGKPGAKAYAMIAVTVLTVVVVVGWWLLSRRNKPAPTESFAKAPAVAVASAEVSAKLDDKSVAVLAFADLSVAHDSEYFSDGISEELLNVLAKVPGLKVTARTSSFHFKGKDTPIPEIAAKLGVAYVIEGSVQHAGERVKITAQLIKAVDGFHVWSDTFTRDAKDVFAVEEEIAGLIAKQLSLKLGATSAAATAPLNPQAFELYVQGRQLWSRRTEGDYLRAEAHFNRALELEPNFARAYVGRADARLFIAMRRGQAGTWAQRDAPILAEIAADIQRALALDPDLAEAHASMGNLHGFRGERDEAVQEYLTAIRLNPNYATAYQWQALEYWRQGRLSEARAAALAAVKADPFSSVVAAACSTVLQSAGDLTEALAHAERAISLQPDSMRSIGSKSVILLDLGRRDEALVLARSIIGHDISTQGLGRALLVLGTAGAAEEVEKARHVSGPLSSLMELEGAAALGKWEEFFAHWNTSNITIDDAWYLYVPTLDPIRTDARFVGLLKETGLLEAHARFQAWRKAHPPEKPMTR